MTKKLLQTLKEMHNGSDVMQLLTDEECSRLLCVSTRTLYSYRKKGLIPSFKLGGRTYYFKGMVLQAMLKIQSSYVNKEKYQS